MRNPHSDSALYGVLLLVYPREFRVRFGNEMMDTFSEEIRSQRKIHGYPGVLRAWCFAFWEVASVAGPLQLQCSMAPALLVSILASTALILSFFAAVTPACIK